MRGQVLGQHAGDVLQQATAGDVGEGFDRMVFQCRQHVFDVQAGRRHQGVFKRFAVQRGWRCAVRAFDALAHERKTVGMQAAGGQAQHNVADSHGICAIEDFGFLNRADAETRQVVLACRVHARHLRRFAANQGAAAHLAAFSDTANHGGGGVHVELAAGEIVQKKQRLGPLHQHVVDAHGDQVNTHGAVHVPFKRKFELGAYAVSAADQYRLFVTLGHLKQRAKTANACQNPLAHGFLGKRLNAFNQRVASVDVNARVFVRKR